MLWEHELQASVSTPFSSCPKLYNSIETRIRVFYFFQKTSRREKGKQLVNFDYQNVNSLCSRHHYVNSARQFCVSIELYKLDCTTQPSTTQHDAMQYNIIRYDTIQCDAIRYDTIQYNKIQQTIETIKLNLLNLNTSNKKYFQ